MVACSHHGAHQSGARGIDGADSAAVRRGHAAVLAGVEPKDDGGSRGALPRSPALSQKKDGGSASTTEGAHINHILKVFDYK